MNDLQQLKAGDEVLMYKAASFHKPGIIVKVDRVTPTQIIIGSYRFSRKTGSVVGESTYSRTMIAVKTAEEMDAIRQKNTVFRAKIWMTNQLQKAEFSDQAIISAYKILKENKG